jgi:hypothetical protein
MVIDLVHVNNAYASLDLDRVDGVMGGDLITGIKSKYRLFRQNIGN